MYFCDVKVIHNIWLCFLLLLQQLSGQTALQVRDAHDQAPVPYAGIWLPDTRNALSTDSIGSIVVPLSQPKDSLWVVMGGYKSWKGTLSQIYNGIVWLSPVSADTVLISDVRPYILFSDLPFKEERYLPETFRSVPDADISTGLDQVSGIRKQVNCGICGTADIHMNGMEGAYTTFMFNGVPLTGTLANIYGIYAVPVSLLREVRITRGPGRVWNGPEGVGGTIDFAFRQPEPGTTSGYAGVQFSSFGEMAADAGWIHRKQVFAWSGYRMKSRIDGNHDGFTDLPLADRYTLFWSFGGDSSLISGMAKGYAENRSGGELNFDPARHRGGDQVYGEYIQTHRVDFTLRSAWVGHHWKTQFLSGYAFHHQNSWYGTTHIWAVQHSGMFTIRGMDPSGRFTAGGQVRMQHLTDNTPVDAGPLAQWWIPSGLAEWQSDSGKVHFNAGARLDVTPFGVVPVLRSGLVWKVSAFRSLLVLGGNGYRMVNVFTEDHASLTGSRSVRLPSGMPPERVTGLLLNYHALSASGKVLITQDLDIFHTRFQHQVFADYSEPGKIVYQTLNGASWLWGMNANLRLNIGVQWHLAAGVSFIYGRYTSEFGGTEAPYLTPPWMLNVESRFTTRSGLWSWMITGKGTGPMRLPEHDTEPRTSRSFASLNTSCYYTISTGWELMLSFQNLTGYRIPNPILGADDPWGSTFDTTRIYGPVTGIRVMTGITMKW